MMVVDIHQQFFDPWLGFRRRSDRILIFAPEVDRFRQVRDPGVRLDEAPRHAEILHMGYLLRQAADGEQQAASDDLEMHNVLVDNKNFGDHSGFDDDREVPHHGSGGRKGGGRCVPARHCGACKTLDRLIGARLLFALTNPGIPDVISPRAASGARVAHRGRPR
jgi:hypothetical protein